jgi:hypothetical protein
LVASAVMAGLPWNPLKKQAGQLATKPLLTQGLSSHEEERELELAYVKLQVWLFYRW